VYITSSIINLFINFPSHQCIAANFWHIVHTIELLPSPSVCALHDLLSQSSLMCRICSGATRHLSAVQVNHVNKPIGLVNCEQ